MAYFLVFYVILLFVTTHQQCLCAGNNSYEADIIRMIRNTMDDVQIRTRPVPLDGNSTVNIEFSISLIHILDFHEANQLLTTMLWKRMSWNDPRISWSEDKYGGIGEVVIPSSMIWTPDVVLYNSMDLINVGDKAYQMSVESNGDCVWMPAAVYNSFCSVSMENFPYDTQVCNMKFGPWVHHENQVNMTLPTSGDAVNLGSYTESSEWNLAEVTGERNEPAYDCCPDKTYVDVTFYFKLERYPSYYVRFLIMPILLMSASVMVIFWIPPTRPDRTSLGMGLFGIFMLLLLLLIQISPPAKNIKLVTYCCVQIVLISCANILTAVVVNINQRKGPLPKCMRKGNDSPATEKQHLDCRSNMDTEDAEAKIKHNLDKKNRLNITTWPELANLLDTLFFVIYFILNILFIIIFLPKP